MRILCLGDSPYVRTGFGVVNEVAVRHLLDLGHEVVVVGAQDGVEREPWSDRMYFVPTQSEHELGDPKSDIMGWSLIPKVVDTYKPDAVHIIGDAAMTTSWLIHRGVWERRTLAYVPIEGAPMNYQWVEAFRSSPNLRIVTTSNYGRKVIKEEVGIDAGMAYHGVSPDFHPMTPELRRDWRYRVEWDTRFVVMCVAQNVRRKQWPRLFEAIAIAKRSVPNILLYAHTVPFNNYWLDGHDLPQLAEQMGIWDLVQFPPKHKKHNDAVGLHGNQNFPGLVELYGMADIFVLPSQVEGFGLPLAEAMACGLPVVTTDYAAQAEVVSDAGILLPVHDWETNRSHTRYANVSPRDIANEIIRLAKSAEYRKRLSRRSLERAKMFTWDDYRATLTEMFGGDKHLEETQEVTQVDPEFQTIR